MTIALWQPARFLRSLDEAEIWNAAMSWAGKPIPLTKTTSAEFSLEQAPDPAIRGHLLRPEAGPDFLAVPMSFPFNALFGADIDVDALARLPAALAHHLDEGIIATLWGTLPDNRMGSVRIVASGALSDLPSASAARDFQWLRLTLSGIAAEPAIVLIGAPVVELVRTVTGGAFAPRPVAGALGSKITAETHYSLGSITLPAAEFSMLQPGDVVVLPEQQANTLKLRTARRTFTFTRHEKGWALMGFAAAERYRTSTDQPEGTIPMQDSVTGQGLESLAIVVDFDLGSLTVPLAAIESWQPGAVIPLNPPAVTDGVEVTVRANGQIIGAGDLVRIDDRIAVRLTRLAHTQKG